MRVERRGGEGEGRRGEGGEEKRSEENETMK